MYIHRDCYVKMRAELTSHTNDATETQL